MLSHPTTPVPQIRVRAPALVEHAVEGDTSPGVGDPARMPAGREGILKGHWRGLEGIGDWRGLEGIELLARHDIPKYAFCRYMYVCKVKVVLKTCNPTPQHPKPNLRIPNPLHFATLSL